MSEEIKDQQENQEPVEEKKEEPKAEVKEEPKAEVKEEAKTEVNEAAETKEQTPEANENAAAKTKKINRLSLDQVNKKISEIESKNLARSIYYKHLVHRKKELEGYPAE